MDHRDYYDVLGVDPSSSAKQIKEAYRELAFKYHPDRNKENPEASERMKAVNEAYAAISNPSKRWEYDALRRQYGSSAYGEFRKSYSEQDIFRGSDIHSVFEDMAKSFGFRGYEDVFKEFYGSGYRRFEFRRPGFFAKGFVFTGRSTGTDGGQRQFPFLGHVGNLSRFFLERITGVKLPEDGSDVNHVIKLTPQQAWQGGPYAYFLQRQSKKLVVQMPPRVREGQRIRLAGMGEDGKGGGRPGDLYLRVRIKKPLLQKMKDLISGIRNKGVG